MGKTLKKLQRERLDFHLAKIGFCERPSDGWIKAIRTSLGMSARQLAKRIGNTQQSVMRLESNEIDDSISLKSLRKAAEALDCKLVYALIPNDGNIDSIVKKQAYKKAAELVSAVDHTMMLEAQGVGNSQEKTKEIAEDLAKNPTPKLWE